MKSILEFVVKHKLKQNAKYSVYKIKKHIGYYYAIIVNDESEMNELLHDINNDSNEQFSTMAIAWMKTKLKKDKQLGFIFSLIVGTYKYEYDCRGIDKIDVSHSTFVTKITGEQYNQKYWKDQGWLTL